MGWNTPEIGLSGSRELRFSNRQRSSQTPEGSRLVFFGKTNTPEFGLTPYTESKLYGPARNPWKLSHSPGGSSGGSAVAVAAGIVPAATASDGGSSIRIPASCCDLFGFKPSLGRVTLGPQYSEMWGGDVVDHVVYPRQRGSARCRSG